MNDEVHGILAQERQILLSWVSTEENIADGPSRGQEIDKKLEKINVFHLGRVWFQAVQRGAVASQKNVLHEDGVEGDLYRLRQKHQSLPSHLELCSHKNGDAVVKAFQNKKEQGRVSN